MLIHSLHQIIQIQRMNIECMAKKVFCSEISQNYDRPLECGTGIYRKVFTPDDILKRLKELQESKQGLSIDSTVFYNVL